MVASKKEMEGVDMEKVDGQEAGQGSDEAAPSMEEILRSIRGVISGNEEEASASSNSEDEDDVLELVDMVDDQKDVAVAEETNTADSIESASEVSSQEDKSVLDNIDDVLNQTEEESVEELLEDNVESAIEEEVAPTDSDVLSASVAEEEVTQFAEVSVEDQVENSNHEVDLDGNLISDKVADVATDTLKNLKNSLPKPIINSPVTRGGTTLEELAIEAMKPFLADWLNKNLPVIVKQLVEKEIRKLVPNDDE